MSNPDRLWAVEYEAESAFGEATATFATHRLPVTGMPDFTGLKHPNLRPEFAGQYLQNNFAPIVSTMDGSTFTIKMYLAGHGAATSGATSVVEPEVFLGLVFGNTSVVSAASGTTLTGGTATAPTTTASDTFLDGSLCRIGALGDGDGEGQFYAVASHVTTTLTVLNDLAGAPVNGAVLYSAVNMYIPEDPTDVAVTSVRMRVLTGNLQYLLHGCYPMSAKFTGLNVGEVPMVEIQFGVARWSLTTGGTFPSTVSSNNYTPAANAAGTLIVQTVGTTTRSARSFRDLSIDFTLGHAALRGPGGIGAYQTVIGCKRQPCTATITWTEDADAATTTPALNTLFESTAGVYILLTLSSIATKAVGFFMPRCYAYGDRPVQIADNGVNRLRVTFTAATGPTTTTNLESSAFRFAFS
jgi:hypothetical protein